MASCKQPKWSSMDFWEKVEFIQRRYNFLLMQAKYAVGKNLPLSKTVNAAKSFNPFMQNKQQKS